MFAGRFPNHDEVFALTQLPLIAVLVEDEELPVHEGEVKELGAAAVFDEQFIGAFEIAPATMSDIAVDRTKVFTAFIEKVEDCFMKMNVVPEFQPGLVDIEMIFPKIFPPGTHDRNYLVEIIIEGVGIRQLDT